MLSRIVWALVVLGLIDVYWEVGLTEVVLGEEEELEMSSLEKEKKRKSEKFRN